MGGMGQMEENARTRRKKQDIQKALLVTLGGVGLMAWAVLAPNTLQLLRFLPGEQYRYNYRARSAAARLVARGLAVWVKKNGTAYLRITDAGRQVLLFEQAKIALQTKKRKRWDGRWRMVVFDIPERRRRVRNRLCAVMREVGFERLQDSVWVYPYDCEDFLALLKVELKMGKDVLYAIADMIENDGHLRKRFELPLE